MDIIEICKALGNETRLNIMLWLRDPGAHFPPQGQHIPEGESFEGGVCVGSLCDKAAVAQSTMSHYLDLLHKAGLLESRRYGKWTYYRRNEQTIRELRDYIEHRL